MLNREKRGHQESISNRLPIQTSGQGIYGKQQSGLDVAWRERRQKLRREHLTRKRWPQPPAWLATGQEDGTRESSPLTARVHRTTKQTWVPPTPAARRAAPSGYSRRPVGYPILTLDLLREGLSCTEAEAGRGSREKGKEVASTSPDALRGEGGSDV